ncbi:Endonuclease/exonuclease/phosphatase, partial [Ganoderma leucocontextum]
MPPEPEGKTGLSQGYGCTLADNATATISNENNTPTDNTVGSGVQRLGSAGGGCRTGAFPPVDDREPEHGGPQALDPENVENGDVREAQIPENHQAGNRKRKRKRITKGRLKIASLNMRGGSGAGPEGGTGEKWRRLNQIVRDRKIAILAIQETHMTCDRATELNNLFGATMTIYCSADPQNPTGARGVAIALNKRLTTDEGVEIMEVIPGRALLARIPWSSERKLTILNVYAPNDPVENEQFWEKLAHEREARRMLRPDIMLGDMNMVTSELDRLPRHPDRVQSVESLLRLEQSLGLADGWRNEWPRQRRFTYLQLSTASQSRIDRIYIARELEHQAGEWEIEDSGIHTDHSMPTMCLAKFQAPHVGKGRWTLPQDLLKDTEYLRKMRSLGIELQGELASLKHRSETENPQLIFAKFKKKLIEAGRARAKRKMPKIDREIELTRRHIAEIAEKERDADTPEEVHEAGLLQDRLAQLEIKRFGTQRTRVEMNDWVKGETMARYWTRLN